MVNTPLHAPSNPAKKFSPSSHGKRRNQHRRRLNPKQQHLQAELPKVECIVCSEGSKPVEYKCPKCRAPYCSVACCKEHKKTCPGKPPPDPKTRATLSHQNWYDSTLLESQSWIQSRNHELSEDDEDEEYQLTNHMKAKVNESEWLRNELRDGGLQKVIRQIAGSRNIEMLRLARQRFPRFDTFIDKLLVIGGVLQREPNDDTETLEPLEDWLAHHEGTGDQSPANLVLSQPVKQIPVFEPVDISSSSGEEGTSSDESATSTDTESSSEEQSGED